MQPHLVWKINSVNGYDLPEVKHIKTMPPRIILPAKIHCTLYYHRATL